MPAPQGHAGEEQRRGAGRLAILLAFTMLASGACSSRLSEEQAREQLSTVYGSVPGGTAQLESGRSTSGSATSPTDGAAGALAQGTTTAGPGVSAGSNGSSTSGDGGTGDGGTGDGRSGTSSGSSREAGKAPIVLGMVGSFSGVLGAHYSPSRDAAAAWAKQVNARGGIDGHPVKLLIADNDNSAGNDVAHVRRLIEHEGAIAIINFHPAAGGADAVGPYAQDNKFAIIGGSGFEPAWNKYVGMFPLTTGDNEHTTAWAKAMKEAGKNKVASVHCTEGALCAERQKRWKQAAQRLGLEVVYEGQVSLAQPDYTASCTSARSAGAEAMLPILDGAGKLRLARDCDRQGYNPLIINSAPANDAPAYAEGMIAPISSFPWFLQSGSPALDEYGAAMKKYTKSQAAFSTIGWTAGKLLERTLTGRVSDQPQKSDVLEGLYALKGETLGGLVQPLTFTRGKPAPTVKCTWLATVKDGRWTAPIGMKTTYCS